ncbi:hypothetical protein [Lysinibacillus sp. FSL W8-0953]|uniref:hypothetical protein n=1 Tax=Lysinibacillus sp. FSL W8-0953 TaxID=2954640 RepID=UPI0030FB2F86
MTIYSGIFNSVRDSNGNGDRKYDAWWFAKYFSMFIGNGVFPNPSTNLQVVSNENMKIVVKPGSGWIDGYFIYSDGDHVLSLDVADGVLKRIDRIVMRLDHLNRKIDLVVKKGTFASSPVAPSLQRDTDYVELALADVLISNGATQITQSNITDQRFNKMLCGIVKGTVDEIDTTGLFVQYGKAFEEWFEHLQTELQGDIAANLQLQIDRLMRRMDSTTIQYGIDTGTANAKTVTLDNPLSSYFDGMAIAFKNKVENTGSVTINVDGLGVKTVKKGNGNTLSKGNLKANVPYQVRYNGTDFFLSGEGGGGNAQPGDVRKDKTFTNDFGEQVGTLELRPKTVFKKNVIRDPFEATIATSGSSFNITDAVMYVGQSSSGPNSVTTRLDSVLSYDLTDRNYVIFSIDSRNIGLQSDFFKFGAGFAQTLIQAPNDSIKHVVDVSGLSGMHKIWFSADRVYTGIDTPRYVQFMVSEIVIV